MNIGDVVMTKSIRIRSTIGKNATEITYKSNPGHAMLFLCMGGISQDADINTRPEQVLKALGWVPSNDEAALREALAELEEEKKEAIAQASKANK